MIKKALGGQFYTIAIQNLGGIYKGFIPLLDNGWCSAHVWEFPLLSALFPTGDWPVPLFPYCSVTAKRPTKLLLLRYTSTLLRNDRSLGVLQCILNVNYHVDVAEIYVDLKM